MAEPLYEIRPVLALKQHDVFKVITPSGNAIKIQVRSTKESVFISSADDARIIGELLLSNWSK